MPTNFTENYHLSQWEAADPVLREDFKADNAKIDAAIAERLGAIELIQQTTLTEDARSFDIDLSMIDWNQWSIVAIAILGTFSHNGSIFYTTLPEVTLYITAIMGKGSPGPRLVVFFPRRSSENNVQVLSLPNSSFSFANEPFSKVTTLHATLSGENGVINKNASIIVYGIR